MEMTIPAKRCSYRLQTVRGGEGHLVLRSLRQGNLPVAVGQIQCREEASHDEPIQAPRPGASGRHQIVKHHSPCDSPHRTRQSHPSWAPELGGYTRHCWTLLLPPSPAWPPIPPEPLFSCVLVTDRAVNTPPHLGASQYGAV